MWSDNEHHVCVIMGVVENRSGQLSEKEMLKKKKSEVQAKTSDLEKQVKVCIWGRLEAWERSAIQQGIFKNMLKALLIRQET